MLNIYESLGTLHLVVDTLEVILKTEHEERGMLNHYKHWICQIPVTTVRVFNYKFKIYRNLTTADAKYVALVVSLSFSFPSFLLSLISSSRSPSWSLVSVTVGGHGSNQDLSRLQSYSLK
jgi:hypothetical protein